MTSLSPAFCPEPIARLISFPITTNFLACHQVSFVDRFDLLKYSRPGSVFLLNTISSTEEVWDTLPVEMQKDMIERRSNSTSSALIKLPRQLAWVTASIRSCRPVSSQSAVFCLVMKLSKLLKIRSGILWQQGRKHCQEEL